MTKSDNILETDKRRNIVEHMDRWIYGSAMLIFGLAELSHSLHLPFARFFPFENSDDVVVSMLTILGIYIIVDGGHKSKEMEALKDLNRSEFSVLSKGIDRLSGIVDTISLADADKFIEYITSTIKGARNNVSDLSWAEGGKHPSWSEKRRKLEDGYNKAVELNANRITYREIIIFSRDSRRERAKRRLSLNMIGYGCAYYLETEHPRIQFMIVDDKEVIFMKVGGVEAFSSRNEILVAYFSQYYDRIWSNAKVVKTPGELQSAPLPF